MTKRLTTNLLAVGVILGSVALWGLGNESRATLHGSNLQGSWVVTVTPVQTPSGSSFQSYNALITFTQDGNVVETSLLPPSRARASTAGHGEWTKTGMRSFALTYVKLLSDERGNFTGLIRVSESLEPSLSLDDYRGVGKLEILDSTGDVIESFDIVTQATRIHIELLL